MELHSKILEILAKHKYASQEEYYPVIQLKEDLRTKDQKPPFILLLLDSVFIMERKGLIKTTISSLNNEYEVRITKKGLEFLANFPTPSQIESA